MVTNQILKSRNIGGLIVRQRTKDSFFSITDILNIGNKIRLENGLPTTYIAAYTNNKSTQEFISELKSREGKEVWIAGTKGRKAKDDKTAGVWAHPLIFVDFALWINPKLKVETYNWILDQLVKYRTDSGDNYIVMTGALFHLTNDKTSFKHLVYKTTSTIKEKCQVSDWNTASQSQLEKRKKIQDNIIGLCSVLRDAEQAVRIGIAMEQ